jgi:hypothetical protein
MNIKQRIAGIMGKQKGGKMHSREDEACVICRDGSMDDVYKDIAVSLGRIADMLAEMNRYIIDYDDEERR